MGLKRTGSEIMGLGTDEMGDWRQCWWRRVSGWEGTIAPAKRVLVVTSRASPTMRSTQVVLQTTDWCVRPYHSVPDM